MAEKTVQVALRIPESWITRADRLAERLTMTPEIPVNRTAVLRAAMGKGLDAMEAEHGAGPADAPTVAPRKAGNKAARKP